MYNLQKASFWRRLASFLLDLICLTIIAVGASLIISLVTNYDSYNSKLNSYYEYYGELYGVEFGISSSEYEALTDEEKENLKEAYEAFNNDKEAIKAYSTVCNFIVIIPLIGLFTAFLVVDFIVPVILKNGQTLGKKLFGVCVVKKNCVEVTPVMMFIRTIIGKYAIETALPLAIVMLLYFGRLDFINLLLLMVYLIAQIVLLIFSKKHTLIHDLLAYTAVADMETQIIFKDEQERIAKLEEEHQKLANKSKYF